jgi:hypothetical protein
MENNLKERLGISESAIPEIFDNRHDGKEKWYSSSAGHSHCIIFLCLKVVYRHLLIAEQVIGRNAQRIGNYLGQ